MVSHKFADAAYAVRKAQELSEQEKLLVGNWYFEYEFAKYEIKRLANGTYELVYHGEEEGEKYIDYMRGIWWIQGGYYRYHDMESSYLDFWFENMPFSDRIVSLDLKQFHSESPDGSESWKEARIDAVSFEFWKRVK